MKWWGLIKEEHRNFQGTIDACIENGIADALSPDALPAGLFRDKSWKGLCVANVRSECGHIVEKELEY